MRPCFVFKLAEDDSPSTLSIFDEIGFWGVQAKDFIRDLRAVKSKVLNVEINSPGGDVFAGLAIYNALKSSGKEIVVRVMGVAASAASLIAMAGDKIIMPKNTFMMIHNPWSFATGNADALRETADTLEKIGFSLRATYARRTKMSEEDLEPLLAKDTWMTAEEALGLGFATEVVDEVTAQAKFDVARADLPQAVAALFAVAKAAADPAPSAEGDTTPSLEADPASSAVTDPPSSEATDPASSAEATPAASASPAAPAAPTPSAAPAASDGGAPEAVSLAERIAAEATAAGFPQYGPAWGVACRTLDEVAPRVEAAREITALCVLAKHPGRADAWIRAGKSVEDVRALLIKLMADEDEATHTDSTAKKNSAPAAVAGTTATTADIWAIHKGRSKGKTK